MKKIPNLFLIGLPKAGTTSLFNYLNEHSEIFLADNKEPHFFNTDTNNQKNLDNIDKYLKIFIDAKDEKYIGEGSTHYSMSDSAPLNIKNFSPKSKIIIMLRKPSDLIYSAYYQNVYNGIENAKSFEEALKLEDFRKQNVNSKISYADSYHLLYSRFVQYEKYLKNYFNAFGRENVLVILFDDFKKNTEREYIKVLNFLSLEPEAAITFSQYNASKEVQSEVLRNILRKPPKLLIAFSKIFFPRKTRRFILTFFKRKNTKYVEKEKISLNTEKMLTLKYTPEVEKLEELLSVNLSHWKL